MIKVLAMAYFGRGGGREGVKRFLCTAAVKKELVVSKFGSSIVLNIFDGIAE